MKSIKDRALYYSEMSRELESNFEDLDICGLAYEYVLNEMRQEISEVSKYLLGVETDIVNDCNLYVYCNYMCTDFDNTEETREFLTELLAKAIVENYELPEELETFAYDYIEVSKEEVEKLAQEFKIEKEYMESRGGNF